MSLDGIEEIEREIRKDGERAYIKVNLADTAPIEVTVNSYEYLAAMCLVHADRLKAERERIEPFLKAAMEYMDAGSMKAAVALMRAYRAMKEKP